MARQDNVVACTYELTGPAAEIAAAHFAAIREVQQTWWELAKRYGASGFRPGHRGSPPRGLIFEGREAPSGWRATGRPDAKTVECMPHKGTKIGKAALADLEALGRSKEQGDLAGEFGWHHTPVSGRGLYFATALQLSLPSPRYFVTLPRFDGDAYELPEGFVAVTNDEYRLAVATHNVEAAKARATGADQ